VRYFELSRANVELVLINIEIFPYQVIQKYYHPKVVTGPSLGVLLLLC
jgi:hypothetical protein